jgi:hypothetical protein
VEGGGVCVDCINPSGGSIDRELSLSGIIDPNMLSGQGAHLRTSYAAPEIQPLVGI